MYNAELKSRFVKDYTKSINTANVATTVFEAFEPYETSWNADLCTRDREELQPAIDEILALRSRSQWMSLTILKEYVKWCIAMKVPDACDGMLNIEAAGLAKVRRQMVSSPLHLQRVLDEVFDKESEETIDVTYRCYYWMAFGGIKEDDTLLVRASDIDFANMEIVYQDTHVPLYREALPAFHKAAELNSFCYKNPNYSRTITRDRVSGDTLMRGIRAVKRPQHFVQFYLRNQQKPLKMDSPSNNLVSTEYGCQGYSIECTIENEPVFRSISQKQLQTLSLTELMCSTEESSWSTSRTV